MIQIPNYVYKEEKLKTKTNFPLKTKKQQKTPSLLVFKPTNKHFHNTIWNKIVLAHELFSHLKPLSSSLQSTCYWPVSFSELSKKWTK